MIAELTTTPTGQPTAFTFGVIVMVLLQLAQFFFALRRDQARAQSAKKVDLTALRREVREEVKEVRDEVKEVDTKLETMKRQNETSRGELHEKINGVALQTSALVKGQEVTEQTLAAIDRKLDALKR